MEKIEIKNRYSDNVLFEYEKENNTIKDTLQEAVKQDICLKYADLEGADLEGAYLKGAYLNGAYLNGANLEGAYLRGAYLNGAILRLYDEYKLEDKQEIIERFEKETNIKIEETYVNKCVLSPFYMSYWQNALIIKDYEYIKPEKEVKERELV